jgi:hypothetical protein
VKFIGRGSGVTTFLTATEAVFSLPIGDFGLPIEEDGNHDLSVIPPLDLGLRTANLRLGASDLRSLRHDFRELQSTIGNRQSAIRMKLVSSNPTPQIEGLDRLPGISNYFIGNDPKNWRTNIPQFAKVRCRDVYPGIDLVYYSNGLNLEYDFEVKPGARPESIQLAFQGADSLELDEDGSLRIRTSTRDMRQRKPVIHQKEAANEQEIAGRFVLQGKGRVSFEVSKYDMAQDLVIDPSIDYFEHFGGTAEVTVYDIAVDAMGNTYVTGSTTSADFPTTIGSFQPQIRSGQCPAYGIQHQCEDLFVTKLGPDGRTAYSTFIGGTLADTATAIAIDAAGNAFITGSTESTDFAVSPGAFQAIHTGTVCGSGTPHAPPILCTEGFILKLNPVGSSLLYSSYLGGTHYDAGTDLAVDPAGNAYVTGSTDSLDFPTVNGIQPLPALYTFDAFVAKMNPSGTALLYCTYLGGDGADGGSGIVVDSSGAVFVTGSTTSFNFPTRNPLQSQKKGASDAFLAKIGPAGNSLIYCSYLGGSKDDSAGSIALDAAGNVYVAGVTSSNDFPTAQAFQSVLAGENDLFISKWRADGGALLYSTYLSGTASEALSAIKTEPAGNLLITGQTASTDFPIVNPTTLCQSSGNGFLASLNSSGTVLRYSTFVSNQPVQLTAMAIDDSGAIYLAGTSGGLSFLPSLGSYRGGPAFVTKLSGSVPAISPTFLVPIVLSASGLNQSFFTTELVLTNRSSKNATVEMIYTAAFGAGSGTVSDTLPAGQQRIIPNAVDYLRSHGLAIPDSGDRGGTLFVRFLGLPGYFDAAVMARTTTPVTNGSVGLAYAAVPTLAAFSEPVYLCGLRQNATDRSNVAIQNVGLHGAGGITLRLTVYSGDPARPIRAVLPEQKLEPGEFRQFTEILRSNGRSLNNGYVRVERISGQALYYAYAVINDQMTSDGSFVSPVSALATLQVYDGVDLPVVLETEAFTTEVTVTNFSEQRGSLLLRYNADAIQTQSKVAECVIDLEPGEQRIIPNYVDYLRSLNIPGVQERGPAYIGKLFAVFVNSDAKFFIGARTLTTAISGRYGVFYPGIVTYNQLTTNAWIYGLRQDSNNRTNLAIVNPSYDLGLFSIDLFDGETGQKVSTIDSVSVPAYEWKQIDRILATFTPGVQQGYARVRRTAGQDRFIAYAVTNDGGSPGERTGDGAFISSSP